MESPAPLCRMVAAMMSCKMMSPVQSTPSWRTLSPTGTFCSIQLREHATAMAMSRQT